MTTRGAQLALKFPLSSRAQFETFEVGGNAELVGRLQELADSDGFAGCLDGFVGCLLYGPPGVGRSHLLQATCHRLGRTVPGGTIYLPLGEPTLSPASLEGLDSLALVALDDVDAWLGRDDTERALLALYQGLHLAGGRLLVSAAAPATGLEFRYGDLASRLRGLPTYQVRSLDDAQKARVLRRLAAERGLDLPQPVVDFWLSRSARDLARLLDELNRLDDAAMAAQRRITVPLLKEVLGL